MRLEETLEMASLKRRKKCEERRDISQETNLGEMRDSKREVV